MSHLAVQDPGLLRRVVSVINGKGGVLKTSITANVGGRLAAADLRILVVDLDISGNLMLDLGLINHDRQDGGKALVDAIWSDRPLPVVSDVRPGLDIVFGGRNLEMLKAISNMPSSQDLPGGGVPGEFARKLAEVAPDYDLILLDCPPGVSELQDMALAGTRWVLIPTKTDQASWDGLLSVGPRVKRTRASTNPYIEYLGVVITDHNPAAKRVWRNTRDMLEEVGDSVPLLTSFVRHSQTAAHDCRSRGQLAHELARDAKTSKTQRLRVLSSRRAGDNVIALPTALSETADSLAGDYARLAKEITDRVSAAETAGPRTVVGGRK